MPYSSYYKSMVFILMVLVLASCASRKSTVAHKTKRVQYEIVDYGKKHLHKPYQYGGRGPFAFDCSGFTLFVFGKFGYKLVDSSAGQARQGVAIGRKEELEIGDLVFFEGRTHNGRVGHVGIVSELNKNGTFYFIHASTSNGVIITSSEEPYYKERYLRGGRIIKDKPTIAEKQENTAQYNYANAQDSIIYKETADGFVAINTSTGSPVEGEPIVSSEQTSKPTKSKKEEDKKKNRDGEIRQAAIRGSEESPIKAPSYISHKVKPGETLFSISQTHNCSVEQLKKWNPEIMENRIEAGHELHIYL